MRTEDLYSEVAEMVDGLLPISTKFSDLEDQELKSELQNEMVVLLDGFESLWDFGVGQSEIVSLIDYPTTEINLQNPIHRSSRGLFNRVTVLFGYFNQMAQRSIIDRSALDEIHVANNRASLECKNSFQ